MTKLPITILALLLLLAGARGQSRLEGIFTPKPRPCPAISIPTVPWLQDYPTYLNYQMTDDPEVSVQSVNGQWVEGRVYLAGAAPYCGMVDANGIHYVEAIDGTTPIDGGHAFSADWTLLVTVSQWDGLIVLSPYGNWVQHVPYFESDLATVRVANHEGWIYYSLNGEVIFSQAAPSFSTRDLRAYYIGEVDSALIGISRKDCGDTQDRRRQW